VAESFAGITVPAGEPEEVFSAGAALSGVAGGLEGVTAQLRGLPETLASWRGPASISYGDSCLTNGSALSAAELALSQCAVVAQSYARDLDEAQDDARSAIRDAREAQRRIDSAQAQLTEARDTGAAAALRGTAASAEVLISGLTGAPDAGAMADLDAARADADAAGRREAGAKRELEGAEEDLRAAKKRGERAQQAADDAARAAAGAFEGLASASPAAVYAGQVAQAREAARVKAAPEAKEEPSTWDKLWGGAMENFGRGTPLDGPLTLAEHVMPGFREDFGRGLVEDSAVAVKDLAVTGVQLTPSYRLFDPAGQDRRVRQLRDTASFAYHDPVEFLKQAGGIDHIEDGHPGRFTGGWAAILATGGAGAAIKAPAAVTRVARAVPDTPEGSTASVGRTTDHDYRRTFFGDNPDLRGQVAVHHAVEQQVQKRYPDLFDADELHSLENLRGIPNADNSSVHLSEIRKEWNRFYKGNPNPTREQLLEHATTIDRKYGGSFRPPR